MWKDQAGAQKLLKEKSIISAKLHRFQSLEKNFKDIIEFAEILEKDTDHLLAAQLEYDIVKLYKEAKKYEIECLFAGEADNCNAFLEINAGAG
ncbi:MAG: PCRF domain-containing protein, partial [Alphaproteobacteria bacterium]|nr:PCRF domain-containing protein [Alphaproteobacteria bacterium]